MRTPAAAAFGGHFGEGFFVHYDHQPFFSPVPPPSSLHPAIINISQAIHDDDHESFQDGQALRSIHARTSENAFIAECWL